MTPSRLAAHCSAITSHSRYSQVSSVIGHRLSVTLLDVTDHRSLITDHRFTGIFHA